MQVKPKMLKVSKQRKHNPLRMASRLSLMPQLQVKEPQDAIRSQCEFELRAKGGSVVGAHNSGNPKLQTNVTKRVELGVGGKRGGGKDQQEKKKERYNGKAGANSRDQDNGVSKGVLTFMR